jgi:DNA-nicking Smr family endonuclease
MGWKTFDRAEIKEFLDNELAQAEVYMKKKKKDIFHAPFKDLKKIIELSPKTAKRKKPQKTEIADEVCEDERYFHEAMTGVTPIRVTGKEKIPGKGRNVRPSHAVPDEEREVLEHLRDLVKGSIEMDITFSDEYIEGAIRGGVSTKIMKQLKRGRIPVQDHVDLHGCNKIEAEALVRDFLIKSHKRGLRCVLIVHGRGLNSPDSFPVLKERLPVWLNRGPARKIVLAFATARPYDGGTGAIYVLLRKR